MAASERLSLASIGLIDLLYQAVRLPPTLPFGTPDELSIAEVQDCVLEVKLVYGDEDIDDMIPQFTMIVAEALQDGADVSIATSVDPSLLGLDD